MMHNQASWSPARAAAIIAELAPLEGATLPILHALQEEFGYVDPAAVPLIADALNMSRAEVHGCLTFYHDFRQAPAGRRHLKLCRAEACQAMGCDDLHDEVLGKLGVDWRGTTADGAVTVEPAFCLGLCANGPSAMIDERPMARATAEGIIAALREARQ